MRVYGEPLMRNEVIRHLQAIFRDTPLEIVAGVLLRYPHLDDSARKILGSYNEFVGILADDRDREHLDRLRESDADDDRIFQRARGLSHDFRDALLEFFFDEDSGMCDLTRIYGVF
jgi:hypothetical protein